MGDSPERLSLSRALTLSDLFPGRLGRLDLARVILKLRMPTLARMSMTEELAPELVEDIQGALDEIRGGPSTRSVAEMRRRPHGRILFADEPHLYHCNHYNFWLQHTVLLADPRGMEPVIIDAAAAVAHNLVLTAGSELGLESSSERLRLAAGHFAHAGFGLMRFEALSRRGGLVRTPVSHYGQCLQAASEGEFSRAQNLFDQGFAAGAAAAAYGLPLDTFEPVLVACHSVGADVGVIELTPARGPHRPPSPGPGPDSEVVPPPPSTMTSVDEKLVTKFLSELELRGNEEGLMPRFGVMLTLHFANFYSRISFEFLRRMEAAGLADEAERLLVEAGHRCAFNTLGGVMTSAEWDAMVRPECESPDDWVHGIAAVINAFGWGLWQVAELSANHAVFRVYDDYESRGHLSMYGTSERPVSFLARGAAAGLMNLIFIGDIHEKPLRDEAYYRRVFESDHRFTAQQTRSIAQGADYTEIVVTR